MENKQWNNIKVLIVEDSRTQLETLKEILERRGAQVIEALDGKEGLKCAKANLPLIIISDIEMPQMNGYELCRSIKEDYQLSQIPVILLTNLSDPMDVIKGIECGADNFLTKPCSEQLLASSIEDAVANQQKFGGQKKAPELEFTYHGKRHKLRVNQNQITELLLSTYSTAIEKNKELEQTNRKLGALHLELQRKNEELRKLIDEKNLLLGMAAHDLRNPLNAIQGYSGIIEMKLSNGGDESIMRMINTIAKSSKFMLDLVNDLLNLSVLNFGRLTLNLELSDFSSLVSGNCKINEIIADQKEITLNLSSDPDIPSMMIDANKIEQVLNNLIGNAIKYSHPGSKIDVLLKKDKNNILLSVQDEGVGIPEEEKDLLFEMFSKGRKSKGTSGEPSTGLGLAIAKRIVEEHRGKIWVESKLGMGSKFFVSLPCMLKPEDFSIILSESSGKETKQKV